MTYHSIVGLAVALLVMAVLSPAQPSAQDSNTSAISTPDQAVKPGWPTFQVGFSACM